MEATVQAGKNLTESEVSRRLRGGIVVLFLGLCLAVVLGQVGASAWARASVFVPFFVAANVFFQGVLGTCGFSAMRGHRNTVEGSEPIACPQERRACRQAGKRQMIYSFVSAAAMTLAFVAIG